MLYYRGSKLHRYTRRHRLHIGTSCARESVRTVGTRGVYGERFAEFGLFFIFSLLFFFFSLPPVLRHPPVY